MDDLAALEAFSLRNIDLIIRSTGEDRLSSRFWQSRDQIDIHVSADFEIMLSEAARYFFQDDELGFGGRIRCEPELKVTIHSSIYHAFSSHISIEAQGKHFVDFEVFARSQPSRIDRFRQMVSRRPSLANLELPLLDESERAGRMIFRLPAEKARTIWDLFAEVTDEWFQDKQAGGELAIANVNENRDALGPTWFYHSAVELRNRRPWFFDGSP
jgi:hypothetical protein